ncbi:MAG: orotidine-5'-phosphate decarboxylase [Spirochaeta sp. LUC14_002_19_P3]|nr:MAG: orotidine-5'-phosphate decarboxylase [Spirochaeta sp. LUC14_002_19_P3]
MTFYAALNAALAEKGGPLCVGIDPRIAPLENSFNQLYDYGRRVVDAVHPYAAAFKPQSAFFECHGPAGLEALNAVIAYIQSIDPNYPIILDVKRGDIGSTAEAYAQALLDRPGAIAVTLSPYLGRESIAPFLRYENAFAFILCRTTNPGADALQELPLADGTPFYIYLAREAAGWELSPGAKQIGLVTAGNNPAILRAVREVLPDTWFLAPGIGAQGGKADEAVAAGARRDGKGLLAAASRSVADAANPAAAARELRDALDKARSLPRKSSAPAQPLRSAAAERRELLEGLFRIGAFQLGEFTLKSGKKSPFYIDLRRIGASPRLMQLCGRAYASLLSSLSYEHLAAIPVAALPLGAAAAMSAAASLIYPRMEQKFHGTGARVEGLWKPGDTAVLLDDLITTGGSKLEAAAILREAGLRVNDLAVLIERGRGGRAELEAAGIRLYAWADVEELLQAGLAAGFVNTEEAERARCFVGELDS